MPKILGFDFPNYGGGLSNIELDDCDVEFPDLRTKYCFAALIYSDQRQKAWEQDNIKKVSKLHFQIAKLESLLSYTKSCPYTPEILASVDFVKSQIASKKASLALVQNSCFVAGDVIPAAPLHSKIEVPDSVLELTKKRRRFLDLEEKKDAEKVKADNVVNLLFGSGYVDPFPFCKENPFQQPPKPKPVHEQHAAHITNRYC